MTKTIVFAVIYLLSPFFVQAQLYQGKYGDRPLSLTIASDNSYHFDDFISVYDRVGTTFHSILYSEGYAVKYDDTIMLYDTVQNFKLKFLATEGGGKFIDGFLFARDVEFIRNKSFGSREGFPLFREYSVNSDSFIAAIKTKFKKREIIINGVYQDSYEAPGKITKTALYFDHNKYHYEIDTVSLTNGSVETYGQFMILSDSTLNTTFLLKSNKRGRALQAVTLPIASKKTLFKRVK